MGALSFRLPDTKHQRLKELAKSKGVSINHLLEEATTLMLAEFDLKTKFDIRANRGQGNENRGLELLEKAKNESVCV